MKEASGDQYMWFDYIQNSIGTCFFICVCMQRSARKMHSKLTIVTAEDGIKTAVGRGRRFFDFIWNVLAFSELLYNFHILYFNKD